MLLGARVRVKFRVAVGGGRAPNLATDLWCLVGCAKKSVFTKKGFSVLRDKQVGTQSL